MSPFNCSSFNVKRKKYYTYHDVVRSLNLTDENDNIESIQFRLTCTK